MGLVSCWWMEMGTLGRGMGIKREVEMGADGAEVI